MAKPRPLEVATLAQLDQMFGSERDCANWDREDFLRNLGKMRDAFLYSIVFAPTFIEVEGVVFLAELGARPRKGVGTLAPDIRAAKIEGREALAGLLSGYNWIEVPHLFADNTGTDEADLLLAHIIADAWRARLAGLYPARSFEVRIVPANETGGSVGVGFAEVPIRKH